MIRQFEELKRRKVFRVGGVYVVAAWVLIQVADTVMPALQMPDWTVSFVTVLLALGLPVALVLAWAYEITPDGIRADTGQPAAPVVASSSDRLFLLAIFALLVASLGYQLLRDLGGEEGGAARTSPARTDMPRLEVSLPPELRLYDRGHFDLSRDGTKIVFSAEPRGGAGTGERAGAWVRPLDALEPHFLPGTGAENDDPSQDSARYLRLSPDGRSLLFRRDRSLFVASLEGGATRRIAADTSGGPAAWGNDGRVYYYDDEGGNLVRVDPVTGASEVVHPASGDARHGGVLSVLPGEVGAIVGSPSPFWDRDVLDFRTGRLTSLPEVQPQTSGFQYLDSGHLLYLNRLRQLVAAGFDLETLSLTGETTVLLDDVSPLMSSFRLSDDGTLVYGAPAYGETAQGGRSMELVWADREGTLTPVDAGWNFAAPVHAGWSLSPDGTRIAYQTRSDIWIKQLPAGPDQGLTLNDPEGPAGAEARHPAWSSDGGSVLYALTQRDEFLSVWAIPADGSRDASRVLEFAEGLLQPSWGPQGEWLVFRSFGNVDGERSIYAVRPGVDAAPLPIAVDETISAQAPAISPDGRWLAYSSDRSGRDEIYVRPFPDIEAGRVQVSTDGGMHPVWSADGSELFFVDTDRNMTVAGVRGGPDFEVERREVLFTLPREVYVMRNNDFFDVTPDGQRFLLGRRLDTLPDRLIVVLNFDQELRRRLGAAAAE